VSGKFDSCKASFAERDSIHRIAPNALDLFAHSVLTAITAGVVVVVGGGGGGDLTRGRRAATSLAPHLDDHDNGDDGRRRHPEPPGYDSRAPGQPLTAAAFVASRHRRSTTRTLLW